MKSCEDDCITELYGVVNCASIMGITEFEFSRRGSVYFYERRMQVNCFGCMKVIKAFLPKIRQSHGRIVNITSIGPKLVTPRGNGYAVSKAAFSVFTDGLRLEMNKFGVKVVEIEPWLCKTQLVTGHHLLDLKAEWESTPQDI